MNGGDGFFARHDQGDPNIVYASSQDGNPVRFDRRTGPQTGIRPNFGHAPAIYEAAPAPHARAPAAGAAARRGGAGGRRWTRRRWWTRRRAAGGDRPNWDAPYITSNHSPTRLYWGSQYLYRTDDRGASWVARQPGPDAESGLHRDSDHGQGVAGGFDRVP